MDELAPIPFPHLSSREAVELLENSLELFLKRRGELGSEFKLGPRLPFTVDETIETLEYFLESYRDELLSVVIPEDSEAIRTQFLVHPQREAIEFHWRIFDTRVFPARWGWSWDKLRAFPLSKG